ncbi:MAG TPA: hypothetical protein VMZ31_06205 [Phycisphaerae bacterium]|nr:hypothetical protein [Phycisphaerae bacterium]
MPQALDFNALATPARDGQTLLQPAPGEYLALLEQNRRLLDSYRFSVLDVDVQDLRSRVRTELVGTAEQPVVGTGHQPEFIHPGVWAKHVVTRCLAELAGARAFHLVVDNDVPDKTTFTVPSYENDYIETEEACFGRYRAGWAFEQLPPLSQQELRQMGEDVRRVVGHRFDETLMPAFLEAAGRVDQPRDFVDQMIAGRSAIDRKFGAEMIEHRVSEVWGGPLLALMIRDAERFAQCYNAALGDYRREQGIRGAQRPVPDLLCRSDRVELPVWAYDRQEARQRLFVGRGRGKVTLLAGADRMGDVAVGDLDRVETALAAIRNATARALRPRALSLTTWVRVLGCDVFVHGIGGAQYDRITDRLIQRYFGVDPPGMICVSATLCLRLPRFDVAQDDLDRARRRQRDLAYNPQRYLKDDPGNRAAHLIRQKHQAVRRSDALREHDWSNHDARRETFGQIRRLNGELLDTAPDLPERFAGDVERIRRRLASNRLADSREYFVGLFPPERLAGLADRLRAEVG